MQIVQSNFFTKSNNALNTAVKNASCSHGWLRWVVQLIFGAITVASFVMIVHMAMQRPAPPESRCEVTNCRVQCSDVKFDETEEDDVISTVMETGLNCERIILTLRQSTFENSTMPLRWMSRMPTKIHVLDIIGGNLRHIPSTAFVGQFARNIRVLTLEELVISQWMSTTFVGLSSLRRLFIKNCVFGNIAGNALQAIEDTVDTLTVTHSGQWDPASLTGHRSVYSKLVTVDFSFNNFGNIIRGNSFVGLRSCKTLYLNSCKITAIGAGAFDPLLSIELLFLSNNLLHTVPPGLFKKFLISNSPKPRIYLENNHWTCNCLQEDLIQLSKKGLLPVDTTCTGPTFMHGKTIRDLEEFCENSARNLMVGMDIIFLKERQAEFLKSNSLTSLEQPCFYGEMPSINTTLQIVSPVAHYQCQNITFIPEFQNILRGEILLMDLTESNWLKPTFILQKSKYSVIQVSSTVLDYGLIWYQTSCPNEVYCLNAIPNFLRVYNTIPNTEYTFCPFDLKRFAIPVQNCVNYNLSAATDKQFNYPKYSWNATPFLYIGISLLCIGLGAMCVYMIIRKNPILLKGSKRLLFVKHRNVDALVLPPKVPLRNKNSMLEDNIFCSTNDKIFTVPDGKLYIDHFMRSNSVRSDKSGTPTYISAMQPTDAQLAEWRIRHHFDKSPSIISISSDISTVSWTSDRTSAEITTNVVYESLK